MLVWLFDFLSEYIKAFGVFQYLTLRGILGVLTALFISLAMGPAMALMLAVAPVTVAVVAAARSARASAAISCMATA